MKNYHTKTAVFVPILTLAISLSSGYAIADAPARPVVKLTSGLPDYVQTLSIHMFKGPEGIKITITKGKTDSSSPKQIFELGTNTVDIRNLVTRWEIKVFTDSLSKLLGQSQKPQPSRVASAESVNQSKTRWFTLLHVMNNKTDKEYFTLAFTKGEKRKSYNVILQPSKDNSKMMDYLEDERLLNLFETLDLLEQIEEVLAKDGIHDRADIRK